MFKVQYWVYSRSLAYNPATLGNLGVTPFMNEEERRGSHLGYQGQAQQDNGLSFLLECFYK